MTRVLILYYSTWGHIERMAHAAAEGVQDAGAQPFVKRVPETIPGEVLSAIHAKADQPAPVADPMELADYDALLIGTPTRYGNMAGQMRTFLDQTGKLWQSGALIGKPAGVFTSTGSMHGGHETTLLSMMLPLMHHGMLLMSLPCNEIALRETVSGGTPYGPSHCSEADAELTEHEKRLCWVLGERLAKAALALKGAS